MLFDITYWIVLGIGAALSAWAAWRVKGTFAHFSGYTTRSGMTGADVARRILADHGITDVAVEPVPGALSDHYDPRNKVLRLSEPVYGSASVSAFGVAAHEVGHAIQHAQGYAPLKFRSSWVPVANLGSGLSLLVIMIALGLGAARAGGLGTTLAWVGILLFSATTIFTLITLPVEFDASRRALATLEHGGYLSAQELDGARRVLNAAALTYVAAAVTSLMQLLYWAHVLGLFGGHRREE